MAPNPDAVVVPTEVVVAGVSVARSGVVRNRLAETTSQLTTLPSALLSGLIGVGLHAGELQFFVPFRVPIVAMPTQLGYRIEGLDRPSRCRTQNQPSELLSPVTDGGRTFD